MPSNVGINVLRDCIVTVSFAPEDLGGGESYSGPITIKIDKVTQKSTRQSADHSTAQDLATNHRLQKSDWEVTLETKFSPLAQTVRAAAATNDLAQIVVTDATGNSTGMTATGLIIDNDVDYASPSTYKLSIKCHGGLISMTG